MAAPNIDSNTELMEDPEDVLASSLDTLFDHSPITLSSSAGSQFIYEIKAIPSIKGLNLSHPSRISLRVPDTQAANWSLHASSIWTASVYLADRLEELHLEEYLSETAAPVDQPPSSSENKDMAYVDILELGAGAGLPSIAIARMFRGLKIHVVSSDYPDDKLISTLEDNARANEVNSNCSVVPYAWGSDPSVLLGLTERNGSSQASGFDVVFAADTLWNSDAHEAFVETLKKTLKKSAKSRIHLVAGLHTGRYTIQSMLSRLSRGGFDIERLEERRSNGNGEREWSVDRADGEDEQERRRWLIWLVLKWSMDES